MIHELQVQIDSIDKIFHISDIHIRIFKRHDEYKYVFENVYSEINKRKTNNSICIVAGDIFHSKTDLGPEQIDLVSEFLEKLSSKKEK